MFIETLDPGDAILRCLASRDLQIVEWLLRLLSLNSSRYTMRAPVFFAPSLARVSNWKLLSAEQDSGETIALDHGIDQPNWKQFLLRKRNNQDNKLIREDSMQSALPNASCAVNHGWGRALPAAVDTSAVLAAARRLRPVFSFGHRNAATLAG